MPVTKGVVKAICLKLIGGVPINGVPTTTALGMPVTTELSLGGLTGLAGAVSGVAGAVGAVNAVAGAAGGLSAISQNPVGALTGEVQGKLNNLCSDNFANLDSTLPSVATDPDVGVSDAYTNLKTALGGRDGASGALSKIQKFKDHTDRLSGQKMSIDSDLDKIKSTFRPGGR